MLKIDATCCFAHQITVKLGEGLYLVLLNADQNAVAIVLQ